MWSLRFRLSVQREAERPSLLASSRRHGRRQIPRSSRGRTATLRIEFDVSLADGRHPQRLLPFQLEEGLHRRSVEDSGRQEGDRESKTRRSALGRHHPQPSSSAEEWTQEPKDWQEPTTAPCHCELLSVSLSAMRLVADFGFCRASPASTTRKSSLGRDRL